MTGAVLTRIAYDGSRRVEFRGEVLAAATTQRPGIGRWTEMTVYRTHRITDSGGHGIYVVAKVGRSIMAHKRTCLTTNTRHLPAYVAGPGQGRRMGCLDCSPQLDPPAGDVVVEVDRNRLYQADSQLALFRVLFPGVNPGKALSGGLQAQGLVGMSAALHRQLLDSDPDFQAYLDRAATNST